MVSKIERQNAVANYLLDNPQASPAEISEALCITDRNLRHIINSLIDSGMIARCKRSEDSRWYRFVLNTRQVGKSCGQSEESNQLRQLEVVATQLEKRGLWRRAATVWAELSRLQKTVTGVAMIASRRNRCIRLGRA
ncbi:PerC family transcriptional regulator [Kluyvera cryocrescens]|uniref:PerC family transcriptional regulator n=1 Tax=Kluyvera cryocrescens TaxID=580 RepID=UPI0039F50FCE